MYDSHIKPRFDEIKKWLEEGATEQQIYENLARGNPSKAFTPDDIVLDIPVEKGRNVLAVRVLAGSAGWRFVCGQPKPPIRYVSNNDDVKDLLRRAAEIVGQVRPEVLFAPDPCVDSECHADHLNAGRIARELAFFSPFPEIMQAYGAESAPVKALAYYMTAKPNRFVGVRDTLPIQRRAVLCHESQFPEGSEALRSLSLYLKLRAADFGLRSLKGQAEGFRVLGTVQMHCLPEAG